MPFGTVAGLGAVGGLASAGASIFGGISGANAAKSAANAETQSLQQGINFQQSVYGQGQQNLQPFIGGGQAALGSLLGFYGLPGGNPGGAQAAFNQFTGLPSYQFPLQQGNLALNRQLASSGLTGSGAALKDATAYNQGYASQGLGQYLSGLSGLVGGGQSASTSLLQGGNQAAGTLGNLYGNQGVAQAGGIVGANNALQQGIQNAIPGLFGTPGGSSTPIGSSSYSAPSGGAIGGLINAFGGGGGGGGGGFGTPNSYSQMPGASLPWNLG